MRADEAAPGSGLGLAIVRDLVEVYAGTMCLENSPKGGLRATSATCFLGLRISPAAIRTRHYFFTVPPMPRSNLLDSGLGNRQHTS